jgi:hypothetical protein
MRSNLWLLFIRSETGNAGKMKRTYKFDLLDFRVGAV